MGLFPRFPRWDKEKRHSRILSVMSTLVLILACYCQVTANIMFVLVYVAWSFFVAIARVLATLAQTFQIGYP